MLVHRHVFGSIRGYQTLGYSPGLTEGDCRAIELFQFGNPERNYVATLGKDPAYLSRPLGQDRRVVTRVLPGPPDDQGRATLRFISVVVATSDWDQIQRDAWALLQSKQLWQWQGEGTVDPVQFDPPTAPRRLETGRIARTLELLSLLEECYASGSGVCVSVRDFQLSDLMEVERLLPAVVASVYTCGHRMLNPGMPLHINSLVDSAEVGSGTMIARAPVTLSPYAQTLIAAGVMRGEVPERIFHSYDLFGIGNRSANETSASTMSTRGAFEQATRSTTSRRAKVVRAKTPTLPILITAIAALGAGLGIGYAARPAPPSAAPWQYLLLESLSIVSSTDVDRMRRQLADIEFTEEATAEAAEGLLTRRQQSLQREQQLRESLNRTQEARLNAERALQRTRDGIEHILVVIKDKDWERQFDQLKEEYSDVPVVRNLVGVVRARFGEASVDEDRIGEDDAEAANIEATATPAESEGGSDEPGADSRPVNPENTGKNGRRPEDRR